VAVGVGETIPVDGRVIDWAALVNQAAVIGEDVPVRKEAPGRVVAGSTLVEGRLRIQATEVGAETTTPALTRSNPSSGPPAIANGSYWRFRPSWITMGIVLVPCLPSSTWSPATWLRTPSRSTQPGPAPGAAGGAGAGRIGARCAAPGTRRAPA
jgi:magnesium-transporting ATPase (P-type)